MIRIKFEQPRTNIWRRWLRDCETATGNLINAYQNKQPIEFIDLYKRKSIKETVYLSKNGPFRGICAYCEAYIADFQHGDIDHFRPKGAVSDENSVRVVVRVNDGIETEHPGYYWLAYRWSNLLPTCITCNQPGPEGIGKHDRFPLEEGQHALIDEDICHEKPAFFNPIDANDDDPENHFTVDLNTGVITAKNGSKRADTCIKIFGLNLRDQLVKERRSAIAEVKATYVNIIFGSRETALASCKELEQMEEGCLNHSLARRGQISEIKKRQAGL